MANCLNIAGKVGVRRRMMIFYVCDVDGGLKDEQTHLDSALQIEKYQLNIQIKSEFLWR